MALRIIFMGTPAFAVPSLRAILGAGHDIAAVYTQPPRPAGRGQAERRSPVHEAAVASDLRVMTPRNFRDAADRADFAAIAPDVAVVVAYGLLLPASILAIPRHGCLNLHGSLLPRWRGAAPIQRAVMAGDAVTGAMVMKMDEGLDTGPVALSESIPIGPDMTAGQLHDEMMQRGAHLIVRALADMERGTLFFTPQPAEGATYASKIDKAEARIDWSRPAVEVHNLIRGLSPYPGAWTEVPLKKGPVRIRVLASTRAEGQGRPGAVLDQALTIACGNGAVRLLSVQREGRAAMAAEEFLRGTGDLCGMVLGEPAQGAEDTSGAPTR